MHRTLIALWTVTRVVATVVFLGWASLHLRKLDPVIGFVLPGWLKPAGIVLLFMGGIVVLLCGGMLSTPGIIPTKFVVLGPFRYTRNPMSLGLVTTMFGLGPVLSVDLDFALLGNSISHSARDRGSLGRVLFGEAVRRELCPVQALSKSLASDPWA